MLKEIESASIDNGFKTVACIAQKPLTDRESVVAPEATFVMGFVQKAVNSFCCEIVYQLQCLDMFYCKGMVQQAPVV